MEEKEDEELAAIKTVLGALKTLKPEARDIVPRVMVGSRY
jgi:hypothetical protein